MSEVLKNNVVPLLLGVVITMIFVIVGWVVRTIQFNKGMKHQQSEIEKLVRFETSQTNKQSSNQFVADKRLEWISEVRTIMTDYLSLLSFSVDQYVMYDKDIPTEIFRELSHSVANLKLLINFDELLDMKIVKLAEAMYRNLGSEKFGVKMFNEDLRELTMYTQIYLKLEWERIKMEADGTDKIAVKEALIQKEKYLTKSYELREDSR